MKNFNLSFFIVSAVFLIFTKSALCDPLANRSLKGIARIIPYKITSRMWHAGKQESIPTPPAVIEKIGIVLRLWESVPEAGLQFKYAGVAVAAYDDPGDIPDDGAIYFVLNGKRAFGKMVAGVGGYSGKIPNDYRKGYVFLNTKAGLYTLKLKTLIHETGHALGIRGHTANIASIMSCGTPSWGGREFLTFSEQDRADLIHIWNPDAVYTVSGRITSTGRKFVFVYAVNVTNGRTFSAISNGRGAFVIPMTQGGKYRIFAKGYEASAFDTPVSQSPSWYVNQGVSTNDPTGGRVFSILDANPRVTGLELAMIDKPAAFNFFWSLTVPCTSLDPVSASVPSFLRPGRSVRFKLIHNNNMIRRVESYGTKPDYEVTHFDPNTGMITVRADKNADPGHRLLIARGADGPVQAGLIGLHIIRDEPPGLISESMENQAEGKGGSQELNPSFWK